MAKYLSRESILSTPDVLVEDLEVPEWGGTIIVREMTTTEVENYSMSLAGRDGSMDHRKMGGMRAKVVAWCVVGEDGEPIFEEGDIKALQMKSNRVVGRIFDKILELSGLSEEKGEEDGDPKEE